MAYLTHVLTQIEASRADIADLAKANGLTAIPSAANFVAIDCGGDAAFAKAVLDALVARDVFLRMPFAAPQNRCIRISCGTAEDIAILREALPNALADARGG